MLLDISNIIKPNFHTFSGDNPIRMGTALLFLHAINTR